ncbi:hypothetical protein ACJX0J_039928 [Zea mays]
MKMSFNETLELQIAHLRHNQLFLIIKLRTYEDYEKVKSTCLWNRILIVDDVVSNNNLIGRKTSYHITDNIFIALKQIIWIARGRYMAITLAMFIRDGYRLPFNGENTMNGFGRLMQHIIILISG